MCDTLQQTTGVDTFSGRIGCFDGIYTTYK